MFTKRLFFLKDRRNIIAIEGFLDLFSGYFSYLYCSFHLFFMKLLDLVEI